MNYDQIFDEAISRLHEEGRYRVFIDILRNKGAFPNARCFAGHNGPKPVTVWCSNDYLAMGQHPKVISAMEEALHDVGAGSGGTRNIGGNTHYHVQLEAESQGEGALLLGVGGEEHPLEEEGLRRPVPRRQPRSVHTRRRHPGAQVCVP